MTPFDFLKHLANSTDWDSFSDEEKKVWNTYFINRIISMNVDHVELVNFVQKYWFLEPKYIYGIYKNFIDKPNFKYIKKSSKDYSNDLLEKLADFFKCSKREIRDYLDILDKDQINEILESMGLEKKEITKLWK